jgi:hypothetical protein
LEAHLSNRASQFLLVRNMVAKLSKLKIREVSLVGKPAINIDFMLFKSETMETPIEVTEVLAAEQPVEPVVETPVVEPVVETPVAEVPVEEPVVAEPEVVVEPVVEEPVITKSADAIELEKANIEKAALLAEIAELRKAAAIEKDAKITKEFIAKTATELKSLPAITADSFGPILKSASFKLTGDEFGAIYAALQAASNFIAQNATLTKELGVGGEDLSAEPAAQLDAIAKSMVTKDANLTYARAYSLACDANPQIYLQHVKSVTGK